MIRTYNTFSYDNLRKNKISMSSSEEHKKLMESVRESQERSRKVLESIDKTLLDVRETIVGIQETNQKYDKIKDDYCKMMEKLADNISKSFYQNPLVSADENKRQPSVISMDQVVNKMMKHEKILFITGAGVSVDSGVPTFRGENGLYSKKFVHQGEQIQPDKFITKQFFDKNPLPIWQWIQSFNKSLIPLKPNQNHQLIHKILLKLSEFGKKTYLITQNIDNLHTKPLNQEYQYHEIHGTSKIMRCQQEHYQQYSFEKINSLCGICQKALRPHVMFFDESYGKPFGRKIKDEQFKFVVVIGTSLNTGLCLRKVCEAQQIVQINPNPVIKKDIAHPFSQNTKLCLAEMLENLNKQK